MTEKKNTLLRQARSWVGFAIILGVVFFGNRAFQTHLGEQALEEMGLPTFSLQEAIKKAQQENKMVIADMSAIWCGTCRKLDKDVLSSPEVQAVINENYIFARIEYDTPEGDAFMARYQVAGFPTLLVLDNNGEVKKHLNLTFDPKQFSAQLL